MPGADGDVDARVQVGEALQDGRQDVGAHRRRGAQRQAAGARGAQVGQRLAAVVDGLDRRVRRTGRNTRPGVGQPHAAAGSNEEDLAQLLLERLDAGGQGGLGHIQRLGRAADVAGAGDLDKGLNLTKQHSY